MTRGIAGPWRHVREEWVESLRHRRMRENGVAELRVWQAGRAGDRGQPGHQKPDPHSAMTHHDAPGPTGPGHRGAGTVEN